MMLKTNKSIREAKSPNKTEILLNECFKQYESLELTKEGQYFVIAATHKKTKRNGFIDGKRLNETLTRLRDGNFIP